VEVIIYKNCFIIQNNPSPSEGIENVSVLPTESEPATFSDSCEVDFNSQYDIAFAI